MTFTDEQVDAEYDKVLAALDRIEAEKAARSAPVAPPSLGLRLRIRLRRLVRGDGGAAPFRRRKS